MGYSPWGPKESDRTERLNTYTYVIYERCKRMVGDLPQVAHRAGLAWIPSLLGTQEFCTLWGV